MPRVCISVDLVGVLVVMVVMVVVVVMVMMMVVMVVMVMDGVCDRGRHVRLLMQFVLVFHMRKPLCHCPTKTTTAKSSR